jgi:hypothetical protein
LPPLYSKYDDNGNLLTQAQQSEEGSMCRAIAARDCPFQFIATGFGLTTIAVNEFLPETPVGFPEILA